jgi:hypothetical protein
MALIEVPELPFDCWRSWKKRPRPSLEIDVPVQFGILGLYVLADSSTDLSDGPALNLANLPEEVFYIGMSTNVDSRLEQAHRAVQRYLNSENAHIGNLWFTTWRSEWSNSNLKQSCGIIAKATLLLYERGIILAYAKQYERLPKANRE